MQFQFDQICYNDIEQQSLYYSEYFDNAEVAPKQNHQEDNLSETSSDDGKSFSDKMKDFGEIILHDTHSYEQEFLHNHKDSLERFNQKAQRVQNALDRFSNKIINFFNKNENKTNNQ